MKTRKFLGLIAAVLLACAVFINYPLSALATNQTPIMGQSQAVKAQMITYFQDNNPNGKSYDYLNSFVSTVISEADIEGVRADVAFALMMKETNFLQFGGVVQESWNNFGGLGVTGSPQDQPLKFPDIKTGIRAVVQHLKAYASTAPLVQPVVDPRYAYVPKGSAPYVEWLGINENPQHVGWATDPGYGLDIVQRVNAMKAIYPMQMHIDSPVNGSVIRGKVNVVGWGLNAKGLQSVNILKGDGSSLGQVTTNLYYRTDVARVYSQYPQVSQNAFTASFDATGLSDGPQTLKVVVQGLNGETITQYLKVTVDNVPRMVVDSPKAGSSLRGAAAIAGWALNISGLKQVEITVPKADGSLSDQVITSFNPRGDVAKVYPGYPGGAQSGFSYNLDTMAFPNGLRTIKVVSTGQNGQTLTQNIQVKINNLPMQMHIDTPASGSVIRGQVNVVGWGLNVKGLQSVNILKGDGSSLGQVTQNLYYRPDVAKVYNQYPSVSQNGFTASFAATGLSNGPQTLRIVVKGNNGETITQYLTVTVDNTPKMVVDSPKAGSSLHGAAAIAGWALNISGLKQVEITVPKADGSLSDQVITSFNPRGDVAKVYPGYPGGAQSGFSFNLDTTAFPNGLRTIKVVSTGQNGQTVTQNIQVKINNLPMQMHIDTPASGSVIRGQVNVVGWGLNVKGLQSVNILKGDGSSLGQVTQNLYYRPDVAKVYNQYPSVSQNGFTASFDATGLSNGPQTLRVVVTGNNGEIITQYLKVNVDNAPKICVDTPKPGSMVKVNSQLVVSGWALNVSGLNSVTVTVQPATGTPIQQVITNFTSRPDVAKVYPGYLGNSGFTTAISTANLPFGSLTVTVTAKGNNNTAITQSFTIKTVKLTVVLDPGHGGRDPGAVANGVNEKDVNLAVALKLRDILQQRGYYVIMTRQTDTDLCGTGAFDTNTDLLNRVKVANWSNGDIFVSIHSNSSPSSTTHYVLGTYFQNGIPPYTNQGYPYDLIAQANAALSKDLATRVANGVAGQTSESNVEEEAHSYFVLRYNHLPSTLIELGFLTNPTTAAAMTTSTWQTNAATGIASGIDSYFAAHQ